MSEIITVGLDLAKTVFQARGADASGCAVLRKMSAKGTLHLKPQTQCVDLEALRQIGLQRLGHGKDRERGITRWNRNGRRNRREIGHQETPKWGTGSGPGALSRAPSGLIFPRPSLPLEPMRFVRLA